MKQKLIKIIADLRFAIFLLLLICIFSIIGTIIEQDQPIEIYKLNYPLNKQLFGFLSWENIVFFGFDQIYKTWWFFCLIFCFGISLITCTFFQQFPSLKIARRCQFFRIGNTFKKLKISTILAKYNFNQISLKLKIDEYSLFQQKNVLYCYKGLVGRLAPIVVHFSIILILCGVLFGALNGFNSQEIISKTEIFTIQNIFKIGEFTYIPNFSTRINDFWITYTKQNVISQFYSNISIINTQGNEINYQTSFVNVPIIYKGVYFYQTDWDLTGIRIKYENNQIMEYPLLKASNNNRNLWLAWIWNDITKTDGIISIVENFQGYCSLYNDDGGFLGNFELNETSQNLKKIELIEMLSTTGLQIKTDYSIPIIYCGFLFLMISAITSYITYSQIWLINKNKQVFIGGNTTRAFFDFELEFLKLIK